MSQEEIIEFLIKNCLDKDNKTINLSNLDLGDFDINLNNIRANKINNSYQVATCIDNSGQKSKYVSNESQKSVYIKNEHQSSCYINNNHQYADNDVDARHLDSIMEIISGTEDFSKKLGIITNNNQHGFYIHNNDQLAEFINNSDQKASRIYKSFSELVSAINEEVGSKFGSIFNSKNNNK